MTQSAVANSVQDTFSNLENRNLQLTGDDERLAIQTELQTMADRWHSPVDLGHGIVTKSERYQRRFRRRLRLLDVPESLAGKRVLDIGTWDGYFAFELERRGAKVFAIDLWDDLSQRQFLFARRVKRSQVDYKRMDVFDVSPEELGRFDLVLFVGVLYHLRYPLQTLEKLRAVCSGQLILETVCMIPALHANFPMIAFFPGDTEAIRTNRHWGISGAATVSWVREALLSSGFSRIEVKYRPSLFLLKRLAAAFCGRPLGGRLVVHAFV